MRSLGGRLISLGLDANGVRGPRLPTGLGRLEGNKNDLFLLYQESNYRDGKK